MANLTTAAQRERLLSALQHAGEIATSEAREYLDCMSPAARIYELRREGWDIATERRRIKDRAGVFHLQAVYCLRGGPLHAQ